MKAADIKHIVAPIQITGRLPEEAGPLFTDSRNVKPKSVFIAIEGTQSDGHDYIEEAVGRGAVLIIGERPASSIDFEIDGFGYLQVSSTQKVCGPLAQAMMGYPARSLAMAGITGTNGKTTVATLVYQILTELGVKAGLLGSAGKRFGSRQEDSYLTTPDPIELAYDMAQMVEEGITHLVMEVSSHALEQQRTEGIDFDIAAFTNLSHDHLDYHQTMMAYAKAKKKLFDDLEASSSAVINRDDSYTCFMVDETKATLVPFSFEGRSSENKKIVPCTITSNTAEGLELSVDSTRLRSPVTGRFNAYNLAQAFLIVRQWGFDPEQIASTLSNIYGAPGRLERVIIDHPMDLPHIFVDYAHSPDALEKVLDALLEVKTKDQNLHVIFGCGGDRDRKKRPLMGQIATERADWVTVTSDNPRSEQPDAIIDDIFEGIDYSHRVQRIPDRQQAIIEAIKHADAHAIILIAGKGHETYQEVDGVRHHFDDREVAREGLQMRSNSRENLNHKTD